MADRTLIHIGEEGEVYAGERLVDWLVYHDGALYVRIHPGAVHRDESGHTFIRRGLDYSPWGGKDPGFAVRPAMDASGESSGMSAVARTSQSLEASQGLAPSRLRAELEVIASGGGLGMDG